MNIDVQDSSWDKLDTKLSNSNGKNGIRFKKTSLYLKKDIKLVKPTILIL